MAPRLSQLAALDAQLDAEGVIRHTLDPRAPEGGTATSLTGLAARLPRGSTPALVEAYEAGLTRTVAAIREHFPDNVFWDLDGLSATLVEEAAGDPSALTEAFEDVVALQALFGEGTAIRFRYTHDFLYGFDWTRWVQTAPEARHTVHPYSREFLRVMLERGRELLLQIEANDEKYPPLTDARHRNPFGFSREPIDELLLHRDLAARGLIPIAAWTQEAGARWDRPYTRAREERAFVLGLRGPLEDHA